MYQLIHVSGWRVLLSLAAALVVLLGLLGLVGFLPMPAFAVALALLAIGLALLLMLLGWRCAGCLGWLAIFFAALSVFYWLGGEQVRLAHLVVIHAIAYVGSSLGQVTPIVTLALFFSGVAMVLLVSRRPVLHLFAFFLVLLVFVLVLVGLAAVYVAPAVLAMDVGFLRMPWPVSLGLILWVLCAASFCLSSGVLVVGRVAFSGLVFVVVAAFFIGIWQLMSMAAYQGVERVAKAMQLELSQHIGVVLAGEVRQLQLLQYAAPSSDSLRHWLYQDEAFLLGDALWALAWLPRQGERQWLLVPPHTELLTVLDERHRHLYRVKVGVLEQVAAGEHMRLLILAVPTARGVMVAMYRLGYMLDTLFDTDVKAWYAFSVSHNRQLLYREIEAHAEGYRSVRHFDVNTYGFVWQVSLWLKPGVFDVFYRWGAVFVLVLGWVLAAALAGLVYVLQLVVAMRRKEATAEF